LLSPLIFSFSPPDIGHCFHAFADISPPLFIFAIDIYFISASLRHHFQLASLQLAFFTISFSLIDAISFSLLFAFLSFLHCRQPFRHFLRGDFVFSYRFSTANIFSTGFVASHIDRLQYFWLVDISASIFLFVIASFS